jgi:hypothetical protein
VKVPHIKSECSLPTTPSDSRSVSNDGSGASYAGSITPNSQELTRSIKLSSHGSSTEPSPPPAGSLSAPVRFRGHHPPGVWDSHKEEIRGLYIDDEMPLREVREVMLQRGFEATSVYSKHNLMRSKSGVSLTAVIVRRCTRTSSPNGALTRTIGGRML